MDPALAGFLLVAVFTALIMSGRLAPAPALVLTPLIFGLMVGHGTDLGPMVLEGLREVAPTGVMLLFAILTFGILTDAGLFDPLVRLIVRRAGGDPLKVTLGATTLAAVISLDGDGSTTYLITCAAMLPLYRRLGMNLLHLACLLMLVSGVMNLSPWGGPTGRAAAALGLDVTAVFLPLLPAIGAGLLAVFALATTLGLAERRRLGVLEAPALAADEEDRQAPRLRYVLNLLILAALMAGLIAPAFGIKTLPLPVLMMTAFALALTLNHPRRADQAEKIAAHAPAALSVAALIFAAGVLTGVMKGTGMVDGMSAALVAALPEALGPHLAPAVAAASLPGTFFLSNDAFYFGMLPVLAEAGAAHGIAPEAMARAALMGQPFHLLSPLVPSTWLLVGLIRVEMGAHQTFTALPAAGVCLVLALATMATGGF
ncbi:MAG: citrate transporter [Phenylobacterium sp.]|uniref:CitMHS family transporter n=1 Tax=Phenylobacterium sp. TaxID=1871053 RepID=UPI0025E68922|nr:citrate:proton symporter [Phenylobacterium sp.]MCA6227806.1 citrate transporter [Phenylobacterium sp.]MCA6235434.1 citrate transporter [Phenylobacterium sp.]MCA6264198.1 citrate transporter [Phenylobacterium sp.]MCA6275494.1 citrate transporter [Phenylobacterium sp.]MCA6281373.1 citrate transporter [Phenylobacterium sp.]